VLLDRQNPDTIITRKYFFYGPSEKFIGNPDESTENTLKELVSLNNVDSACVAIAKFYGVEKN